MLWCSYKGIKRFLRPWGWNDPLINYVWKEQVSLPRGGKSHHRTDLIVEWMRLDAQRGAKLLCGLILLGFLIGLVIGLLL